MESVVSAPRGNSVRLAEDWGQGARLVREAPREGGQDAQPTSVDSSAAPKRKSVWDSYKAALRSPGYYVQVAGAVAGYLNPVELTPVGLALLAYGVAVGVVRRRHRGPDADRVQHSRGIHEPALSGVASFMGAGLVTGALVRKFPLAVGATVVGLLVGQLVGDRLGRDQAARTKTARA
ncbi:MAG: hypothetical protein H6729_12735 [Deltaproteobacteria bacterium]|nr:hypothetical protein [Deltaproteobacteria bacterium]